MCRNQSGFLIVGNTWERIEKRNSSFMGTNWSSGNSREMDWNEKCILLMFHLLYTLHFASTQITNFAHVYSDCFNIEITLLLHWYFRSNSAAFTLIFQLKLRCFYTHNSAKFALNFQCFLYSISAAFTLRL